MAIYADNGDRQTEVRSEIQNFILNHLPELKSQLEDHVRKLVDSVISEDQLVQAVTDYSKSYLIIISTCYQKITKSNYICVVVARIAELRNSGDALVVDVASKCFQRVFLVERPLEQPIRYPEEGNFPDPIIHLSFHKKKHYNFLKNLIHVPDVINSKSNVEAIKVKPTKKKSTKQHRSIANKRVDHESHANPDFEEEDLVVLEECVEPFIPKPNISKKDEMEGLYMLRNMYHAARAKVNVVFLFPEPNLPHLTLADVINEYEKLDQKVPFVKLVVLYTKQDLVKLRKDADLREVYTLYAATFTVPLEKAFHERTKWLSNMIVSAKH